MRSQRREKKNKQEMIWFLTKSLKNSKALSYQNVVSEIVQGFHCVARKIQWDTKRQIGSLSISLLLRVYILQMFHSYVESGRQTDQSADKIGFSSQILYIVIQQFTM